MPFERALRTRGYKRIVGVAGKIGGHIGSNGGINNATSLAVISLLGCKVFPDAKLLSFSIERQNYKNITTLKTSIFFQF